MKRLIELIALVHLVTSSHGQLRAANVATLDLAILSAERRCLSLATGQSYPPEFIDEATYIPPQAFFDELRDGLNNSIFPGFCKLKLSITTNPETERPASAELWLPDEWDWNGRLLATGSHSAMTFDGIQQGYASYISHHGSINGDLNGMSGFVFDEDLEAVGENPEKDDEILDYSWRALHSTTVQVKSLVDKYYELNWTKSYFSGCGSGGRQGIKAMATFPEDYDGLLLGSPQHPLSAVIPWKLHVAVLSENLGWSVPYLDWVPERKLTAYQKRIALQAEVLKQCDGLDGVLDGVISSPEDCHFRPEPLACSSDSSNNSLCLTPLEVQLLNKLSTPLLDAEQKYISSPLMPGAGYWLDDPSYEILLSGWHWPIEYYLQFVSKTGWYEESTAMPNGTVAEIDRNFNPAEIDTHIPDLTAFFKRGGKVIQYAGWYDDEVAPGNSIKWYQDVFEYTRANSDLNIDEHFRLFMVPAMKDCCMSFAPTRGSGAWMFGGYDQRSKVFLSDYWHGTVPLRGPHRKRGQYLLRNYDKGQKGPVDAQAALVEWVESGVPVDYLIATKYEASKDQLSVRADYTRKLCPWPQKAIFLGGDENSHASFECR